STAGLGRDSSTANSGNSARRVKLRRYVNKVRTASQNSAGHVIRQVFLETDLIRRFDRFLGLQGLVGLGAELRQPLDVGWIQRQEVFLVERGHAQRQLEERTARSLELREHARRRRQRDVLYLGGLHRQRRRVRLRGVAAVEHLRQSLHRIDQFPRPID